MGLAGLLARMLSDMYMYFEPVATATGWSNYNGAGARGSGRKEVLSSLPAPRVLVYGEQASQDQMAVRICTLFSRPIHPQEALQNFRRL